MKIIEIKDKINEKEKNTILKCFTNKAFKEIIYKELFQLEYLETEYGFLSTIGIKIKYPENNYEIEGFIKTPDNSPYKNGIFNFIIKYQENYPKVHPIVIIKTKIFHCNVHRETRRCDISSYIGSMWNGTNIIDLPQILGMLNVFLAFNNPQSPYNREYANVFETNYSEFERISQEFLNKYGGRNFNPNLSYLFEGKYNTKNNDFDSSIYLVTIDTHYNIKKFYIPNRITVNEILNRANHHSNDKLNIIAGNKVLRDNDYVNENSNKAIFVIPGLLWARIH